jgi:hypothetical protein
MEGYSIYLMVSLAQAKNVMEKELEYDTAWADAQVLLKEFETSEFNVDTKSEYDCMVEFLNSKGDNNQKTITKCSNCGSTDVEIRSWVHQRTGTISGETGDDEDTYCNTCDGHHGVDVEFI